MDEEVTHSFSNLWGVIVPGRNWNDFTRRRWYDFRNGHSMYLVFMMSFVNFVLIFYNFSGVKDTFNIPLWVFGLAFVLIYVPVAVWVGVWHRHKQLRVDHFQNWRNHPIMMDLVRDMKIMKRRQGLLTHEDEVMLEKLAIELPEAVSE